jgi:hypothetical protein
MQALMSNLLSSYFGWSIGLSVAAAIGKARCAAVLQAAPACCWLATGHCRSMIHRGSIHATHSHAQVLEHCGCNA